MAFMVSNPTDSPLEEELHLRILSYVEGKLHEFTYEGTSPARARTI